jgi:hypothetical protein
MNRSKLIFIDAFIGMTVKRSVISFEVCMGDKRRDSIHNPSILAFVLKSRLKQQAFAAIFVFYMPNGKNNIEI